MFGVMHRGWLTYLRLLLAVAVLATSQQMAIARGMPGPAGSMVICSGQGLITVTLDENGNPVGPVHVCPDAALTLMVSAGVSFDAPQVALRWVRVEAAVGQTRGAGIATPPAMARGPPALV